MNESQKALKKIEKMVRQIGWLSYKTMMLSQKDIFEITGNGLLISVKKWNYAPNEFVIGQEFILKGGLDVNKDKGK